MRKILAFVSIFLASLCHADQLKTVFNAFTGKPDYINSSTSSGGGIVSPGTFTWTNTQGISVSTVAISTIPAVNEIPYRGSGGYLVANTSFTYGQPLTGVVGIENLKMEGLSPFIVMGSSNAAGWSWFNDYHTYANSDLWGAFVVHPNAFPLVAQGNLNLYMRDGSFFAFDTTGQGTNDKGFFAYRVAHPADETHPRTVIQANTTGQFLIDNMYEDCAASALDPSCRVDNSIMFLTSSTTRGAIPCPPMTTTQRNAISSPYNGICAYDVTLSTYVFYNGTAWTVWGSGSGANASSTNIVSSTTVTIKTTTSATFVDTFLGGTITPTSASSKVLIQMSAAVLIGTGGATVKVTITRAGSNILGSEGGSELWVEAGSRSFQSVNLTYLDSPATTSATAYMIQIKTSTGSCQFGDTNVTQSLVLTEIK